MLLAVAEWPGEVDLWATNVDPDHVPADGNLIREFIQSLEAKSLQWGQVEVDFLPNAK